jgi:chromate transporter
MVRVSVGVRAGSVGEVLAVFFKLGLTSFGGPVAHLGYFRTAFVSQRGWLSDTEYADLVALCQFLPGPASSQVGIAIGKMRAGLGGAIAAFVGFTLPSALLMLGFAWGALALDGPLAAGALHGLKLAALAVVAQAVWAMSRSLAPDWPRRAALVVAAGLALVVPNPFLPLLLIVGFGGLGWGLAPKVDSVPIRFGRGALVPLGIFAVLLAGLPLLALTGNPWLEVAEKFYRTGSLVFGGGHVVLPLLEQELVKPGLIGPELFLAGYGAAQAVPGPLFSFAAYAGALLSPPVNGIAGAALALGAIYLPSFLLVFGGLPIWDALKQNKRARAGLNYANAAVVGLLTATLITPVFTTAIFGLTDGVIAVAAFLALWKKVPPPLVVLVAAGVGVARVVVGV